MTEHALAPEPVVVLASGHGGNLQVLVDAAARGALPIRIRAVLSDRANAYALQRARRAGITTGVLDYRDYPDARAYGTALGRRIARHEPSLVVLAGFMRILHPALVECFEHRMMNLHPSLLPKYPGLDTHRRVLEHGDREHGASVHFVTGELDAGPLIIQGRVAVAPGDTPDSLQRKVHRVEHRILPEAVRWFAEGRLSVAAGRVLLDGRQHPEQGLAPAAGTTEATQPMQHEA